MINLIEDILDLSRIKFDNFEEIHGWFNFEELVNEIFDMVEY